MRILFILPYIPYPLNSGGNQAVFNMIDRARGVYDISVLFNIRDEAGKHALDALKKVWGDVAFYAYEGEIRGEFFVDGAGRRPDRKFS